jgi:RinA family phage transcriptional activator
MTKNYSLQKHERNYIKGELRNYKKNIQDLEEITDEIINATPANDGQPRGNQTSDQVAMKVEKLITTRSITIITKKIQRISNALNRLSAEDKEITELIFFENKSQAYLETHKPFVSKDSYYGVISRAVKEVAKEYGMI